MTRLENSTTAHGHMYLVFFVRTKKNGSSVERVNSCLGWLHSEKRANLGDDHLLDLAFVRMNRDL